MRSRVFEGCLCGQPLTPRLKLCLLQGDASKSDSEGELFLRSLEEEGGLKKNLSNPVCEYGPGTPALLHNPLRCENSISWMGKPSWGQCLHLSCGTLCPAGRLCCRAGSVSCRQRKCDGIQI